MDEVDEVLDDENQMFDEDGAIAEDYADEESEWHGQEAPDDPQEGELPVDMYQTGDAVVIRALVAGVSPEDLDIAITRDMVVIKGLREEQQEAPDDDYYHRELFWGSFSRTLQVYEFLWCWIWAGFDESIKDSRPWKRIVTNVSKILARGVRLGGLSKGLLLLGGQTSPR